MALVSHSFSSLDHESGVIKSVYLNKWRNFGTHQNISKEKKG